MTQRRSVYSIANSWLSAGARQVVITDEHGVRLNVWPRSSAEMQDEPDLSEAIKQAGKTIGHLQLWGLQDALSHKRLSTDAHLIGHFTLLDQDLNQLTEEVITRQDELVALLDLTQSARDLLDVEILVNGILAQLPSIFGCQAAFLLTERPESFNQVVYQFPRSGYDDGQLLEWLPIVQHRKSELVVASASAEIRLPDNISNLLIAPITIGGSIDSAIGLINKSDGEFNFPNRKLINAIALPVSALIENSLMYTERIHQAKRKHEFDLARDVQFQLLPEGVPKMPLLDIAASSQPAREVGGDFYDFLPTADGILRFTVGDVSGKGIPAAMIMGMAHSTLRSAAVFLSDPSPAAILDHANKLLYDDFTKVSMFATVFCGQFESKNRTVTFANAGHSPVIYCPVDGEARLLRADGTALGILMHSLSEDQQITLNVGDILVVATDGLPEAHDSAGAMFGYERLLRLIERHRQDSAETLLTRLLDAVKQFGGDSEQDDDETIMILKGAA